MKKTVLTLSTVLACLFAASAFAQKDVPGEARAAPSAPATKAEKAAAKTARKGEGAAVAKTATGADDQPAAMGKAKVSSKSDKALAKAKRKSEGAEAAKSMKEKSGPN
jgi:hypothetical protein